MLRMNERQVGIKEAAELLNRQPATLRHWERSGQLPAELMPSRDARGWRYWTESQVDAIATWMRDTDRRPGKGLPHYKPTDAQVMKHITGQRRPRGRLRPLKMVA